MATILEPKRRNTSARPGEPVWDIAKFYPLQGSWTEDDYFALEATSGNQLIELDDGVLEFLPMPDMFHQDVVLYLVFALKVYLNEFPLGRVFVAPMPVLLWTKQIREPDVVFLKSRRIKNKHKAPNGADLVMEVVSPGAKNRNRDLKKKRRIYAKAKIPEYWIIDPKNRTVTVLTLHEGEYVLHGEHKPGEQAASKLLKGFTIDVEEMFAAGEQK